ncbi:6-bladed beta-propeller [Candidatus Atribacteria bacterium MT.SAG.1]|nr:6-bladed beta-propeller [Candidatus Atribacteria bacterium MT.SAG.1]
MKKYIIFISMILLTFLSVNISANTDYITILTFGEYGNREGEFDYPVGIAIDKNSNLYITDWENDRIQKFNSEGRLLKVIPGKESELKIDGPAGIVLDQNENIIVVEQFNNRIHKISPEGKSLNIVGKEGSGPGEFLNPRGIAIDKDDNIYVVDTGNSRIQIFSSDFKYIKQFGREGMGDGEFYYPRGIALDDEGNIYVADTFHNQIQVFNNKGRFLRKFGEGGEDIGEFNGTRYIAFDSKGNIYVTDYKNGKVVKFNKEEQFELEFGNEPDRTRLNYPEGIAIDDRDYIYVVDAGNDSIVKYSLSKIVIHFNFGNKYLDEHKYEEAILEFKQVISLDPLNLTARESIAVAYYENEEWGKAIEAYNYLQNIHPDDQKIKLKIIDSQFNLAVDYEKKSLFKDASKQYKEILNLNPNYPSAKKRYYLSYSKYLFYSTYFRAGFLSLILIIFFIILLPKIKKRRKSSRHSKIGRP